MELDNYTLTLKLNDGDVIVSGNEEDGFFVEVFGQYINDEAISSVEEAIDLGYLHHDFISSVDDIREELMEQLELETTKLQAVDALSSLIDPFEALVLSLRLESEIEIINLQINYLEELTLEDFLEEEEESEELTDEEIDEEIDALVEQIIESLNLFLFSPDAEPEDESLGYVRGPFSVI